MVSEKILEIDQPETIIAYGGHVCLQIGTKLAICIDDQPESKIAYVSHA